MNTTPARTRLPTATYFCLPVFVVAALFTFVAELPYSQFDASGTPRPIAIVIAKAAVSLLGVVFVGLPIFMVMVYSLYRSIVDKTRLRFARLFTFFLLPPELVAKHRWFAPIYYASLASSLLLPVAAAVFQFA